MVSGHCDGIVSKFNSATLWVNNQYVIPEATINVYALSRGQSNIERIIAISPNYVER